MIPMNDWLEGEPLSGAESLSHPEPETKVEPEPEPEPEPELPPEKR